jgi:hypothetical protein
MNTALDHVAAQLLIPPAGLALCIDWDAAMQTNPANSSPFLQAKYIAQAAHNVFLTDDMIRKLVAFAPRVASDESLLAFFWYCRHRILTDSTLTESWEAPWPALDDYLEADAGLLNVLVMLAAVPQMLEVYRCLGIPADLYHDTISDLRLWMETDFYFHRYQRWGITPWIARWLCHHWHGIILQLGRLQFSLGKFGGRLNAYRHRQTRQVIALSEAGIRYTSAGSMWRECCGEDSDAWTSTLESTGDSVTGNPITPNGLAHRTTHSLLLADWELVLTHNADVLVFHVPAGAPLTFESCGDSFHRALEAFPRFYPDFHFRAFWTSTWMMDPRLQKLLGPESNIVRIQREMYVYPGLQGDNNQYYERIFGWGAQDINTVEWKTSLQKTIGAYLNNGGHFHGGYCFLLNDDFNWGGQVYLQQLAGAQQVNNQ